MEGPVVCRIDTREPELLMDMRDATRGRNDEIEIISEMLTLGDVLIMNGTNPLLMIERKTVRDLIQSLRDERYHDQRRRWAQFQNDFPQARVSLWLEGDLLSANMEETLRSSLLNSLLRLQSLHNVLVHQVRGRASFVQSLLIVMDKFRKDPLHLVQPKAVAAQTSPVAMEMRQYKKTQDMEADKFWMCILAGIPGVSGSSAEKITSLYPHLVGFVEEIKEHGQEHVLEKLSQVEITTKRKLGKALSAKIIHHLILTKE